MQKTKTINISTVEFLRSSIVVTDLIKEFLSGDATKCIIRKFVKDNYPTTYDLHLDDSCDFLKNELKKDFFTALQYLSKRFYNIKNGDITYKLEYIEEFQAVSSSLDMTAVECIAILKTTQNLSLSNKERFLDDHVIKDKKLECTLTQKIKEISDQHIHLGGAYHFSYRLHEILKNPYKQKDKKIPEELYNSMVFQKYTPKEYMIFLHHLEPLIILSIQEQKRLNKIFQKNETDFNKGLEDIETLFDAFTTHTMALEHDLSNIYNLRLKSNFFMEFDIYNFQDELLFKAKEYFDKDDIEKGDRYLVFYLLESIKNETLLEPIIQIYFTVRNMFKSAMTQQHRRSGFGYFSSFSSNNDLRRNKDIIEKQHILDFLSIDNKKVNIEGRVTPKNSDKKCADEIASYLEAYNNLGYSSKEFNLRILFHFIKTKDKEEIRSDFVKEKNANVRKEVYKQSKAITKMIKDPKYRRYHIRNERINTTNKYKDIIKHLGGIDAASAEYNVPPEVFAPVFNYFKNSTITTGKVLNKDIPYIGKANLTSINFKYTFHVGEDFRDIISGLRAIFEAVVFLDLKDSDRLGHALALGVSPKLYRKHEIRLPKGEFLDNAIFIYYMLKKFGKFSRELYYYEDIINALTNEMYGDDFTIENMIDGWFLRRNCPYILRKKIDVVYHDVSKDFTYYDLKEFLSDTGSLLLDENEYYTYALPDFYENIIDENCKFSKRYASIRCSKKAYEVYRKYHFDQTVRNKSKELYQENIHLFEEMYEYLQDVMMEKLVSQRSLYIEVQPTSNILIGNISSLEEHPLMRFRPVKNKIKPNKYNIRKTKLKVIINTDNPSIQNTNILLEYYQMYSVLKEKYGEQKAEKYLLDIVKEGNNLYEN